VGKESLNMIGKPASEEDDRGLIVNADRLFLQKGTMTRRRRRLSYDLRLKVDIPRWVGYLLHLSEEFGTGHFSIALHTKSARGVE